jgi:hypothetical protein
MKLTSLFTVWFILFLGCNRYWFNPPNPMQFNTEFNELTNSRMYSKADAKLAVASKKCSYLELRDYYSGDRLNGLKDMKKGAIGVDQWVSLDGGNAFSLEAYRWVPPGVIVYEKTGGTSTELKIEFYTMLCDVSE